MTTIEFQAAGRLKGQRFFSDTVDVVGMGIGPFNLSLAALLAPQTSLKTIFIERQPSFQWHPGLMLDSSALTTSFLKDLVTLADPCSQYSFIAFLQKNERLYSFANARFPTVKRKEFEQYMHWVSKSLTNLQFGCDIEAVTKEENKLVVSTSKGKIRTSNLVVGVGLRPTIPACTQPYIGKEVMHSSRFRIIEPKIKGKRVVVIGGGQSGAEIINHLLNLPIDSAPSHIVWTTRRSNFLPMDDSPFVNEWFAPAYSDHFYRLSAHRRNEELKNQRLASDGITQQLLTSIYQRLYEIAHIENHPGFCTLLPARTLTSMYKADCGLLLEIDGPEGVSAISADLVILATGSEFQMPTALDALRFEIQTINGFPELEEDYSVRWNKSKQPRIFFQNAARSTRGVADPNLSLAAWRSGKIANAILGNPVYQVGSPPSLVEWGMGDENIYTEKNNINLKETFK